MGISTLQSYKGTQILGPHSEVVDRCFIGSAGRIQGATFDLLAMDAFESHEWRWPSQETTPPGMPESGEYHCRDGGQPHINDPASIAHLQDAVREKNQVAYDSHARNADEQTKSIHLRGLLEFCYEKATPIPVEQVEPWNESVRRFVTGPMSYGSISMEAHPTLAIAMNRLGEKGGEDAKHSNVFPNGDTMRSAIKQVASGRFGITASYLVDADDLQIKIARGAKPGEGGELPATKSLGLHRSYTGTSFDRRTLVLFLPPPHRDIYSIEDLRQLIHDLNVPTPGPVYQSNLFRK